MIAAVADVLDVVVLGAARNFTQQTLALSTVNAHVCHHYQTSRPLDFYIVTTLANKESLFLTRLSLTASYLVQNKHTGRRNPRVDSSMPYFSITTRRKKQGWTEYSIRILFGPNSRPNRLFVFGRIILLKVHRIRMTIRIVINLCCSTVTLVSHRRDSDWSVCC